jgi:hypothetical protein
MTSSFGRPLVRRRDDGLQLRYVSRRGSKTSLLYRFLLTCYVCSYQLPHRVYAAKAYPVLAPNGSAIVVYGYENGLRIVWRGGRPFLPQQKPSVADQKEDKQANGGTNDDAVMIIDSDDEEEPAPAPPKAEPTVQFDDEEAEVDPSYPYEHILRHIDIPFGTKVLGVAVPSFLPAKARSSLEAFPPILTKMIVVSTICADSSTRVVAVPLTPPHPTNVDPSTWGIQTLSMSGSVSHHEVPTRVSITFTCEEGEEDSRPSRSQRQASLPKAGSADGGKWELLVATHAAEASGTLLVYRIPIHQHTTRTESSFSLSSQHLRLIQRHALPMPASSISFNPSPYPSERHANLLVAFPDGHVKIFSCLSRSSSRSSRGGQASDTDSEAAEPEGKWLITLYPGFDQSGHRKTVVDAAWVLAGRAVMVLLADGEWGVWDVEGSGPGSEPGPLRGQSSIHGVTGGSLTSFSVSGRIVGNPQATAKSQAGGGVGPTPPEPRAKFAPMTPSTRRVREDTLFKGAQSPSSPSLCGEISVVQTNSSRDPAPEESILLRHGDQIATIPSLLSLWRSAVKSMGTFDASSRCRVTNIGNVNLLGERITGISHLPAASRTEREVHRREFDTLITAEHRLIILAPKLTESGPQQQQQQAKTATEVQPSSAETDQLMLRRGELDVDGMDRVLSGMTGATRPSGMRSPLKRTRVFS